jgi:translation initiation factor 3 subunit D
LNKNKTKFVFLDRYRSQFGVGVGMYQYIHEDDENTFQLVDSTRLPKPAYQKRTRFQNNVKEKNYFKNLEKKKSIFFK